LLQLARIGHRYHERGFARFERNEVVTEHELRGNAAKQLGIDALLRQVDERAAIALGQALGVYSFGGIVATAQNRRVVGGDCH
jgi:hypothetical protein